MTHTVSLIAYESLRMSHKIDSGIPLGVINIMKRFCPTMERSSIDECYLDLTEISRRYKNATDKSQLPKRWMGPGQPLTTYCLEQTHNQMRCPRRNLPSPRLLKASDTAGIR